MFDNKFAPNTVESLPRKILLAEDNSSVRRFIEIILQRANYEVLPAEDGLAAMKIALETEVEAVIADAMMPNLTGYDLCRILRQNVNYQNVPFIILSGFEHNGDSHQADAYLLKEDNLREQLLETLSNLLRTKEFQRN